MAKEKYVKIHNDHSQAAATFTAQIKTAQNENITESKSATYLLKGESAGVLAGAKILESKGYKLDEKSISILRDYMSGDSSEIGAKLEAIELSLEKEMPLQTSLLTRMQSFSNKTLLDFLSDELPKTQVVIDKKLESNKAKSNEHKPGKSTINSAVSSKKLDDIDKSLKKIYEIAFEPSKNDKNEEITENKSFKTHINFEQEGSVYSKKNMHEQEINKKERAHRTGNDAEEVANSEIKSKIDVWVNADDELFIDEDIELMASYLQAADNINAASSVSMVLETKITPKLSQLKSDFETLKKELRIDLYKLSDKNNPQKTEDRVNTLSKNIEKLDNAIMKSEMSLYIDLKGERELLKLSSQLQKAKDALQNGQIKGAEKILKNVSAALEKLEFTPSIKKAFAVFGTKNPLDEQSFGIKDLAKWLDDGAEKFAHSDKSPSSLVNYMRKLGINTEVEQFEAQNTELKQQKASEVKDIQNLKLMLSKLGAQDKGFATKELPKALQHIEGIQLRNKIVDSKEPQSVVLDLPVKLGGMIKNVKVFIKSPQKMLKLDWENFDMFFVLNTKKLGDLGIKVQAIQKNLSVSILNDNANSLGESGAFSDKFKEDVEVFGFNLVKMVLEAWNKRDNPAKISEDREREFEEAKRRLKDDGSLDIRI